MDGHGRWKGNRRGTYGDCFEHIPFLSNMGSLKQGLYKGWGIRFINENGKPSDESEAYLTIGLQGVYIAMLVIEKQLDKKLQGKEK